MASTAFVFFLLIGFTAPNRSADKVPDSQQRTQQRRQEAPDNVPAESDSQPSVQEQNRTTQQNNSVKGEFYSVIKVVDGDTIAVDLNGKSETLRLIGINTPETVDPRKSVECFGREASNKAKEVLTGKKVRLEADTASGERDKYDRLLRYVFLEDGASFNKRMISEGYAYEYTYNGIPYKYQAEYKQAQKEAESAKRGLWADNACVVQTNPAPAPSPIPPADTATPKPAVVPGVDKDCKDFKTHAEAQAYFEAGGGSSTNNFDRLDSDGDGIACESLP